VAQEGWRSLWPGQRYYRTRDLDVRPGIMTRVDPVYPDAAARRFLTGKVVIRLFIDEAGAVERVVTVKAEPPGYFEQSAERAFRAARFTPGMKNGRPVKVQMLLEVRFDSPAAPSSPGQPIPR
jgi:protein TonB